MNRLKRILESYGFIDFLIVVAISCLLGAVAVAILVVVVVRFLGG